jgi:hypothetical protein
MPVIATVAVGNITSYACWFFFVHSRLYGVSIKAGQFYSWSARSAQIAQTNSNAKPEAPSNTASTLRTSSPVPGCGG